METGLEVKTYTVCFVWVVGTMLGLSRLVLATRSKRPRWAWLVGAPAVLLLAGAAAGMYWLGQAPAIWEPPLLLAMIYACILAVSFRPLGQWVSMALGYCRDRRWQAVLLLLGCPLLAIWLGTRGPVGEHGIFFHNGMEDNSAEDDAEDHPMLQLAESGPACTDLGRPVAVYQCSYTIPSQPLARRAEGELIRTRSLGGSLLFVAPPDWSHNCHGWVFTGGKYWIRRSADVEAIIEDNDYFRTEQPQTGDLAIYRNQHGKIIHTGIVRAMEDSGLVLVESKWGTMGRYIHPNNVYRSVNPEVETVCTYYRSLRDGHRLTGLD